MGPVPTPVLNGMAGRPDVLLPAPHGHDDALSPERRDIAADGAHIAMLPPVNRKRRASLVSILPTLYKLPATNSDVPNGTHAPAMRLVQYSA